MAIPTHESQPNYFFIENKEGSDYPDRIDWQRVHEYAVMIVTQRYTKDFHTAEDVAQNISIRLYKTLANNEWVDNVFGWVYTASRNAWLDYQRSAYNRKRRDPEGTTFKTQADRDRSKPTFYSPDLLFLPEMFIDDGPIVYIKKAIAALKPEQRETLRLWADHYDSRSVTKAMQEAFRAKNGYEIAEGTIKTQLRTARINLLARLHIMADDYMDDRRQHDADVVFEAIDYLQGLKMMPLAEKIANAEYNAKEPAENKGKNEPYKTVPIGWIKPQTLEDLLNRKNTSEDKPKRHKNQTELRGGLGK